MNKVSEATIQGNIIKFLKTLPRCKLEKRHPGWNRNGEPDLSGCISGHRFELEVKAPDGKPTELQLARLREWQDAGAIAGICKSVQEAAIILVQGLCGKDGVSNEVQSALREKAQMN